MSQCAGSLDDLSRFLDEGRREFRLLQVELRDAAGWSLRQGVLQHDTGGFFNVVGVDFGDCPGKVFLYQPQSAVTGLLTAVLGGERHVLLHARAEPGNQGVAQYGPSIQSTLANYLALHGGAASPYADPFIRHHPAVRSVLHDSDQLDLGERYLCKSKRAAIIDCDADIDVAEGFIWVPANLLRQAVAQSYFLNTDLRSLLAVFPWRSHHADAAGFVPGSQAVRAGLERALRPEVIGAVCARLGEPAPRGNIMALDRLANWRLGPGGLEEIERVQGFSVEYFHCTARGREVRSWFQPLVNSHGAGYAALSCREVDGALEVLVRAGAESGLKTGTALLPSVLAYPGSIAARPASAGRVLLSTMESDEGGRFMQDTSQYDIVMVPPGHPASAGAFWIGVAELKWFLSRSHFCTLQLRGLSSMLLADLPC